MNFRHAFLAGLAVALFITACAHKQVAPPAAPASITAVATAPLYVPDTAHAGDALPDGVLAWDALSKTVDATAEQDFARFTFSFTNLTQGNVSILEAKGSCSCTTIEDLSAKPWTIPAGGNGIIKVKIDLAGKTGTLFKTAEITTDKGHKDLRLWVNIAPPVAIKMTDEQRAAGLVKAKVDRQAVFKGDCVSCHAKKLDGKYGQQLYQATCGICHDAEHRATMVPDLGKLSAATSPDFWRTWITYGKPGSLMPAFATAQGGPLTDIQIASLAAYLNVIHPPHPAAAQ